MKKLLYTILVCAAVVTTNGYSQACCIYNNTTHPLRVTWTCINDWFISPTHHQCTDGTGGEPKITLYDGLHNYAISTTEYVKIDDHGWVSVYKKENNRWKVVSKHKDGSIKETKYLKPQD